MGSIKIGNLSIDKAFFGNAVIDKIFFGNIEVYTSVPKLATPYIILNNHTLRIVKVDNAEAYRIYANGSVVKTVVNVEVEQNGNELFIENAEAEQNGSEVTIS